MRTLGSSEDHSPSGVYAGSPLLHSPHQPLSATALTRRERIALALERIFVGAKLDPDRRTFELEVLAEHVAQVALVGIWNVLYLIAMNDDDRRIAAALMCIAELDAAHPNHVRFTEVKV